VTANRGAVVDLGRTLTILPSRIRKTAAVNVVLQAPDWPAFFRERASNASKAAFDRLARGREERIARNVTVPRDDHGVATPRAFGHLNPPDAAIRARPA